ncbi:MAG: caspase family protein [Mucilaginibacter sp.]
MRSFAKSFPLFILLVWQLSANAAMHHHIVVVSAAYTEAEQLAQNANKELQAGNVRTADSLITLSIARYPVKTVFTYAATLAKLTDVAGANRVMDKVIQRVKEFPDKKLYCEPFYVKMVSEYDKPVVLFFFAQEHYQVNKAYGNISYLTRSAALFSELEAITSGPQAPLFAIFRNTVKFDQAILYGRKDEALALMEQMSKDLVANYKGTDPELYTSMQGGYYLSVDDAPKAIETVKGFKKLYSSQILFQGYTMTGQPDEALKAFQDRLQINRDTTLRDRYYLALIDIQKGNLEQAIARLKGLKKRGTDMMTVLSQEDQWKIYTALGDAYTKAKQYSQAKDNYNIALLYHPEYKPAVEGMAKLKTIAATDQSTDKTGPEINITEPAPKRGLKVAAVGDKVMVKGFAKDISGIKEVIINGAKVFSQPAGDFWGDVPMVTGINKVTVAAVDNAGNRTEKIFEIEKQAAPVATTADIPVAPVGMNEGKNYCLLIAAQNYNDTSIPSLANPIADAVKLKLVLKNNYNFSESNIISLFNPQTNDLKRQLLELSTTLQLEDNLVIFYAGHGIWVDKEKTGYWLMIDALYKDRNTWVPNKDVLDLISKLPSRHTLLITDACFSGSVFRTRGLKADAPAAVKELDNKISRVAITSGNDTEVPDESVFMKYLIKALNENHEPYLTAQKMFITRILESVMSETNTEPRYGTLELAGHIGGDFIFTKRQ